MFTEVVVYILPLIASVLCRALTSACCEEVKGMMEVVVWW
jgi:hypothetical protein